LRGSPAGRLDIPHADHEEVKPVLAERELGPTAATGSI
jgi:hypothetical protein